MFGWIQRYFYRREERKRFVQERNILVQKKTDIEQAIENNFNKLSKDPNRFTGDLTKECVTVHKSGMTSINRGAFISTDSMKLPKGSPQILLELRDEINNLKENLKTIEDLDKLDQ